jgi:hypothetical protein
LPFWRKPKRGGRHLDGEEGRAGVARQMASTAIEFWTLMERWGVPDEQALALVEFGGKIGNEIQQLQRVPRAR